MTAVTVMLIRLLTAVERTGIERARDDFRFFFLAGTLIPLSGVRLLCSLTRTLPCRVDPDLDAHHRMRARGNA